MSYNPVKNVDFNSLPNYAIANVPILTYALLGITTLTLGYITIKDKEAENGVSAPPASTETAPPTAPSAPVVAPVTAIPETPLEKGGKKRKQTKSNNKKTKKQK